MVLPMTFWASCERYSHNNDGFICTLSILILWCVYSGEAIFRRHTCVFNIFSSLSTFRIVFVNICDCIWLPLWLYMSIFVYIFKESKIRYMDDFCSFLWPRISSIWLPSGYCLAWSGVRAWGKCVLQCEWVLSTSYTNVLPWVHECFQIRRLSRVHVAASVSSGESGCWVSLPLECLSDETGVTYQKRTFWSATNQSPSHKVFTVRTGRCDVAWNSN